MSKRLVLCVLLVAASLCAFATDAPWRWPTRESGQWGTYEALDIPYCDLRVTKDGDDAVLTWTCTASGMHFLIFRGLLQAPFNCHVLVAQTDLLTWTDEDALIRTVLGEVIDEYYYVYAFPTSLDCYPPYDRTYSGETYRQEYAAPPRDNSQLIKFTYTDADQSTPAKITTDKTPASELRASSTKATGTEFIDAWNWPTPSGATGQLVTFVRKVETYANTVDHTSNVAAAKFTAVAGNQTAPNATVRTLVAPTASKDGTNVTVNWTIPTEDVSGTLTHMKLYRNYLGVGSASTNVLVGTFAAATTQTVDSIAGVTADWYCFYEVEPVFIDGQAGYRSPSSTPVRR